MIFSKIGLFKGYIKRASSGVGPIKNYKYKGPQFKAHELDNELYFPYENKEYNGGIEQSLRQVEASSLEFSAKSIGYILYHMAYSGHINLAVKERIEININKYISEFKYTNIYGALYGGLVINVKANLLRFLIETYQEKFKEIKYENKAKSHYYMLIKALALNENLKTEEKIAFIKNNLEKDIIDNWTNGFNRKFMMSAIISTYHALVKLNYVDSKLFELIIQFLKNNVITSNQKIIDLYKSLIKLKENNVAGLDPIINTYKDILINKPHFKWRYNFPEMRYYTYEEMLAKRDDYKYPNQIHKHKMGPEFDNIEEMYQKYLKRKQEGVDEDDDKKYSNEFLMDKLNEGEIDFEEDEREEAEFANYLQGYGKKEIEVEEVEQEE